MVSTAFYLGKEKLRHSLGRPSRSDFVQFDFSDIKEKELYSKVQSINPKQDIVLEDIEWLYEDYEKLSDVFDGLDSDFSFLDSELANYLKKIIYSRNIAKREK